MKKANTIDMWRTMVHDYHISINAAFKILMFIEQDLTQDQIEAELPKRDAWCYARYSFNNRN